MKKGFTLIEVLVTTLLLGLFIFFCYPVINKTTSHLNTLYNNQINYLTKVSLYKSIEVIKKENFEINYDEDNNLILESSNFVIELKGDHMLINDEHYNTELVDVILIDNVICLKVLINDSNELIILKRKVYENNSS